MARTGLFVAPVPGTPPVGASPTDGRLALAGVLGTTPQLVSGGSIVQSASVMQVQVGAAVWILPDVTNAAAAFLSPTDSVNLTPAAGPATGSRIDLIVVKQNNFENGDADSRVNVTLIAGTPGAPGVAPTVPPGYFAYASINVPAGAAVGSACTVTGTRPSTFAAPDLIAARYSWLQLVSGTLGQQATVTSDPTASLNGVYVCQGGTTWVPLTSVSGSVPYATAVGNVTNAQNTTGIVSITFPPGRFAVAPRMFFTATKFLANGVVGLPTVTATGATVSTYNVSTGANIAGIGFTWEAVQQGAASADG